MCSNYKIRIYISSCRYVTFSFGLEQKLEFAFYHYLPSPESVAILIPKLSTLVEGPKLVRKLLFGNRVGSICPPHS